MSGYMGNMSQISEPEVPTKQDRNFSKRKEDSMTKNQNDEKHQKQKIGISEKIKQGKF